MQLIEDIQLSIRDSHIRNYSRIQATLTEKDQR